MKTGSAARRRGVGPACVRRGGWGQVFGAGTPECLGARGREACGNVVAGAGRSGHSIAPTAARR